MNTTRPIPPLTTPPPEGFGAAFDYDYWRWYFYSPETQDYQWVLSHKEWLAVNRIRGFRTDEVWSYADSPSQSAFTEYITWLIEMNILTDETADNIANLTWENPTMYPQDRTMMGFYPPSQPYHQTINREKEEEVMRKNQQEDYRWDNYGAVGDDLYDWKTAETFTGWEFDSPLRNNDDFLETPPAPRKSKDNNIELMGKDIAKMLDFETISNSESQ